MSKLAERCLPTVKLFHLGWLLKHPRVPEVLESFFLKPHRWFLCIFKIWPWAAPVILTVGMSSSLQKWLTNPGQTELFSRFVAPVPCLSSCWCLGTFCPPAWTKDCVQEEAVDGSCRGRWALWCQQWVLVELSLSFSWLMFVPITWIIQASGRIRRPFCQGIYLAGFSFLFILGKWCSLPKFSWSFWVASDHSVNNSVLQCGDLRSLNLQSVEQLESQTSG